MPAWYKNKSYSINRGEIWELLDGTNVCVISRYEERLRYDKDNESKEEYYLTGYIVENKNCQDCSMPYPGFDTGEWIFSKNFSNFNQDLFQKKLYVLSNNELKELDSFILRRAGLSRYGNALKSIDEEMEKTISQIREAFKDAKKPIYKYEGISEAAAAKYEEYDEVHWYLGRFKWEEIERKHLLEQSWHSALSWLDEEHFIYYLPAFLIAWINDFDIHRYGNSNIMRDLYMGGSEYQLERSKEILSLMTNAQVNAVLAFLDCYEKIDNDIYSRDDIKRAKDFWAKCAIEKNSLA